jgi:hypothetical protein
MKVLINPNAHPVNVPLHGSPTTGIFVYPTNFGYVPPANGVTEIEIDSPDVLKTYKTCIQCGMLAVLDKSVQTAADVAPVHKIVESPNVDPNERIDRIAEPVTEVQASTLDAGVVGSRNIISEDTTVDPREEIIEIPAKAEVPSESPVVEKPAKRKLVIKRK